jgi:hypothetical protein
MQGEFSLLTVCEGSSIGYQVEGTPFSVFSIDKVDNFDIDMESLMKTYKNISEEAIVFLVRQQQRGDVKRSSKSVSTKERVSGSAESDCRYYSQSERIEKTQCACSPLNDTILPPPQRFVRASRRANQVRK